MYPISNHPIISLFNPGNDRAIPPIIGTIRGIVEQHSPAEDMPAGIDVLRIGYPSETQPPPVVLVITVKPSTITWQQGSLIAQKVLRVVHQCNSGLEDVHCEVFEADLVSHGAIISRGTIPEITQTTPTVPSDLDIPAVESNEGHSLFWPIQNDWPSGFFVNPKDFAVQFRHDLLNFTSYLGRPIVAPSENEGYGSSGLYLRLSKGEEGDKDTQSINVLVAARHVVCSVTNASIINQLDNPNNPTSIQVFQLPQQDANRIREKIQDYINSQTQAKNYLEAKAGAEALEPKQQQVYQMIARNIAQAENFLAHCVSVFDITKRHIGDVVASPVVSTLENKRRDWALIKLNRHVFGRGLLPNRVCIASLDEVSRRHLEATGSTLLVQGRRKNELEDMTGEMGDFLDITRYFTLKDLDKQGNLPVSRTDHHTSIEETIEKGCLHVYMVGPTTNGSSGALNRVYNYRWEGKHSVTTREYCVISSRAGSPFSQPGDSGSVVFTVLLDENKEASFATQATVGALGFLWGAFKPDPRKEYLQISYVTPFEDVKDTIEEFTGWLVHLP